MNKSCLATIVYFTILGILIYNRMWIWLIIAILVGGLAAFIMFVGVALESGFRSKFPLDSLAHTQWVNRYFEDRGFELVGHNTSDSNYPESIYKKDQLKVVISLNAPIVTHSSFTITVIVSGEQEKNGNSLWKKMKRFSKCLMFILAIITIRGLDTFALYGKLINFANEL